MRIKKMKNKLLVAMLLFSASALYAEQRPNPTNTRGAVQKSPGAFVSEAVYWSSSTCASGRIDVSTQPGYLFAVNITSPGLGAPLVSVFDARNSTNVVTTTIRRVGAYIDARTVYSYTYNVGITTGITVNNYAQTTPACLDVLYLQESPQ